MTFLHQIVLCDACMTPKHTRPLHAQAAKTFKTTYLLYCTSPLILLPSCQQTPRPSFLTVHSAKESTKIKYGRCTSGHKAHARQERRMKLFSRSLIYFFYRRPPQRSLWCITPPILVLCVLRITSVGPRAPLTPPAPLGPYAFNIAMGVTIIYHGSCESCRGMPCWSKVTAYADVHLHTVGIL